MQAKNDDLKLLQLYLHPEYLQQYKFNKIQQAHIVHTVQCTVVDVRKTLQKEPYALGQIILFNVSRAYILLCFRDQII